MPPASRFTPEVNPDEPLPSLAAALLESGSPIDARLLSAVHLAGHVVAANVCGLDYPEIRLEPAPESEGCPFNPTRDGRGHGPARNGIEAAIIATLAGPEAERLAGGEAKRSCIDVTRWITDGDAGEAEPYVEWLRLKAARTVEHPLRQRLILVIARALIERGSLRATDIEALTLAETSRYMRGQ